ncbi:OmpA family protein [Porphyromonas sp.]
MSAASRRSLLLLALLVGLCLTSCRALRLREAERAEQRGDYAAALEHYKQLYQRLSPRERPLRARYARAQGRLGLVLGQYERAYSLLSTALRLDRDSLGLAAELGQAALSTARYEEAARWGQLLLAVDKSDAKALRLLASSQLAAHTAPDSSYQIKPLAQLSSPRSDLSPSFAPDGRSLLLASSRRQSAAGQKGGPRLDPHTGDFPSRIYQLQYSPQLGWGQRPELLRGLVEQPEEQLLSPQLLPPGQLLLSSEQRTKHGPIITRLELAERLRDGSWARRGLLLSSADSLPSIQQPSLSPSGRYLLFASPRAGAGLDLYRAELEGTRVVGLTHLGEEINTLGRECSPRALSDSLFTFASDGHPGYGGLDLYRARLESDGRYHIEHLPRPLNSEADDYDLLLAPQPELWHEDQNLEEVGLLVSSRGDSRGYPHIYRYSRPRVELILEGHIYDLEEEALGGAEIRLVARSPQQQEQRCTSDSLGYYRLSAHPDLDYVMHVSHPGYLSQHLQLHTDPSHESERYSIRYWLSQLGQSARLEALHYALDSVTILPESNPVLDGLVRQLEEQPRLRLLVEAHTDRQGTAAHNEALARERAAAVRSYLLARGIAPERLQVVGYGSRRPCRVSPRQQRRYPFLPLGQELSPSFVATLPAEQQAVCDALNRRTECTLSLEAPKD